MPRNPALLLALALPAAVLLSPPASAWFPKGHSLIAEAAVRSLPEDAPRFLRSGAGLVAHCAQDPDVFKQREAPALNDAEGPEHYIDWELLKGRPLPPRRSDYLKLCGELGVEPRNAGTVPYAIAEWTERLAVGLAEHRKWPANPYVQTKCQVYAGILAHYGGDLCMPLHTTLDHDGRARPDGSSPRTGIHAKLDSLIERLELRPEELAKGQQPEAFDALIPAVTRQIEESRRLIDRAYQLQAQLPPASGPWTPSPEVTAFGTERARASTRFVASLYLTAWRKSASIRLPTWLEREQVRALPPPGPRLAPGPVRKPESRTRNVRP
ncbi:MAG TPA: hypothetical protein VFU47_12640 [Armatimonadota bacterium]|nr:hypothetical protein [Armatimonadota bacterium]